MNIAEFFITIAQRLGVDTAFSITGGMAMHVNRAVGSSGLWVIYCNHEQACVAAADGYSKMREYQVPGLAIVTSGPGVTNVMTSLASAYHDSVPLIVIAGQVKCADINPFGVRSYGAQEVPALELVRPIVKDALRYIPQTVNDQRLAEFFASAVSGRKGPVFVEIPLDLQSSTVEAAEERVSGLIQKIEALRNSAAVLNSEHQEIIRKAFQNASRPVLFLGNGNRIAGVSRVRLMNLAEALGAPVMTTWPSSDLFDSKHRLHFGCPGGLAPTHSNRILQNADLILFLGVRLDLLTTGFNPGLFGKRALRIIVDIDPAELSKFSHFTQTHLVLADVGKTIEWLESQQMLTLRHSEWLDHCIRLRDEDTVLEAKSFGEGRPLNARNIAKIFSEKVSKNTLVATGSGYAIEGFARFFAPTGGSRLFYAGHCLGSMGLGFPTAIGAASANAGPVICLEGDGGIMFNLQELLTLQANADIKLSLAIFNNGGYLSISRSQKRAFGAEYGASAASGLGSPDFCALAEAFGLDYVKVTNSAELEAVLDAIEAGRSRVIFDIGMEQDDYRGPAIVTKFREDGTPYSSDIEEIAWKNAG